LVERLHGMQEVSGSIPLSSTIFLSDGIRRRLKNPWNSAIFGRLLIVSNRPCLPATAKDGGLNGPHQV
jgi:hypothetical protein